MNPSILGLRHVALTVTALEACTDFYIRFAGMHIEWQPDPDNVYLTSGTDNLALHRAPADFSPDKHQRLDHLGFFLATRNAVDELHAFFVKENIAILRSPRDHRDGTRSFYCKDPDGNIIQFIHHPNICS